MQRRQPSRAQVSDPHVSINVFRASLRNRSCFSRALRVLAVARGTRKGACVLFCHLGCYTSGGGLVAVCPQTSPWNAERSPFWLPPVRWQLRSWSATHVAPATELMGIWCVQSATPSQRARSSTMVSFIAEVLGASMPHWWALTVRVLLLHVQACAEHFQKSVDTADGVRHASHPP